MLQNKNMFYVMAQSLLEAILYSIILSYLKAVMSFVTGQASDSLLGRLNPSLKVIGTPAGGNIYRKDGIGR